MTPYDHCRDRNALIDWDAANYFAEYWRYRARKVNRNFRQWRIMMERAHFYEAQAVRITQERLARFRVKAVS